MSVLSWVARCRDDRGMSLPTVLLVALIGIAAGTAVATTTTFTIRQMGLGRERVQARAAAEAGIDVAIGALEQSSGTSLPCATQEDPITGVARGVDQDPGYTVTIEYLSDSVDADGNYVDLGCPPSQPPAQAVITSGGTSASGISGSGARTTVMEAALRLRAGTGSWADRFGDAVFSQAGVETTNQWTLLGAGADFYTGGDFRCNSNSQFDGGVFAQGTANVTNSCRIMGDLWARDQITTSTMGISFGGDIKSSTGGLTMGNNPVSVGGDIMLAGSLVNSNGKMPNVGGTISQNLGAFENPPSQAFPEITFDPADWTAEGWTYMTWRDYIDSIKTVPPAASWWTNTPANYCQIANAGWSLNKAMVSPTTKTVVDARATDQCPSGRLEWSNTNQLKLRNDLTIVASNFVKSGNLTVTSIDAEGNPSQEPRTLRIIVPWTTGSTCAASPTTTMSFANATSIESTVTTLLYTSGAMVLSNNLSLSGQLYGCKITPSNAMEIRYVPVGGPTQDDTESSGRYEVDVLYKRDA